MTVQSKAPAAGGGQPPEGRVGRRAAISAKTLRTDRWWIQPVVTFVVLFSFIIYSTWAAFIDRDYFSEPYISPFYSPCLAIKCGTVPGSQGVPHLGIFGHWWFTSPAIIILIAALSRLGVRNSGRRTSTPSATSSRTIVRVLITGDPPSGRPDG